MPSSTFLLAKLFHLVVKLLIFYQKRKENILKGPLGKYFDNATSAYSPYPLFFQVMQAWAGQSF